MLTMHNYTDVTGSELRKVTYERKDAFLGLISWYVKVSTEKISDDLVITTTNNFDKIYLNGVDITPKQ